ncbi:MAG: carbohydrate ABC transporter permease [Clostridiales bacterium]|nr:carbohydrate ABC transporter permease [Clostridiales bacterium]
MALLPFVLLIIASFTDNTIAVKEGYSYFPSKWSLDAYAYIWRNAAMIVRAYGVTIAVTVIGTAAGLVITALYAYMLSKKGLPGRKFLIFFVILTMLFNGGLVPTYLVYSNMLHIKDTLWALIVPTLLMNGFNVILIKNYFENNIPGELYESARIDGAGEWFIFSKIAMPLSRPILATVGLLMGIAYWNDWQNGLYYLNDTSLYSIQNILNQINQNISYLASSGVSGVSMADLPTTTIRMAIAFVGILPIVIAYPFFQKNFAKGITMGSVKG